MSAFKSGDPLTLSRLYGRSSGHKLRKGQRELVDALLPQIEVPAEGDVTAGLLFGEDRPLHPGSIGSDGVPDVPGQRPSLLEPKLAVPGPGKAILRIRHDGEQSH